MKYNKCLLSGCHMEKAKQQHIRFKATEQMSKPQSIRVTAGTLLYISDKKEILK